MKRFIKTGAAAALIMSMASGTAMAATLTSADLTPGASHETATASVDGVDVTVAAGSFDVDWFNIFSNHGYCDVTLGGKLTFGSDGMGVKNSNEILNLGPFGGINLDSGNIDGFKTNDIAVFSFDEAVRLTSIGFDSFDGFLPDEFVLFVGDSLSELCAFSEISISELVALDVVGKVFGIGARSAEDDFVISSVSFDAVPLPAAAPLFASAIVAGAFARRRKARA